MQNKKTVLKPTAAFEERLRRIIREEVRNVWEELEWKAWNEGIKVIYKDKKGDTNV